jgi:hypothetical protein
MSSKRIEILKKTQITLKKPHILIKKARILKKKDFMAIAALPQWPVHRWL